MRITFDSTSYRDAETFHRHYWMTVRSTSELRAHQMGLGYATFTRRVAAWNRAQARRTWRSTKAWADRVARDNPPSSFRFTPTGTVESANAQLDLLDLGVTPAQVGGYRAVKAAEAVA